MNIPKSFEEDLEATYVGGMTFDNFIKRNSKTINRMAIHATRYADEWTVMSVEDVYQEACLLVLKYIWDWDDERGATLCRFVTYRVGVDLQNLMVKERRQKRRPKICKGTIDVHERVDIIRSTSNPEHIYAVKEAIEKAEKELSQTAQLYATRLAENDGIYSKALDDMMKEPTVIRRYGNIRPTVKYILENKIRPELTSALNPTDIIPS